MVAITSNTEIQGNEPVKAKIDTKTVLVDCPLFDELAPEELDQIAPFFRRIVMTTGDWVFREGAEGANLYIVADGRVEIFKESTHRGEVRVAIEKAGRAFGEMALIDGEPRSASAFCAETGHLLMLRQEAFEHIVAKYPNMAVKVYRRLSQQLSRRLRQATGVMVDHLDH